MKTFIIIMVVLFFIVLCFIALFVMAIWRAILGYTDTAGKLGVVGKNLDTKINKLDLAVSHNTSKLEDNTRATNNLIRKQYEE